MKIYRCSDRIPVKIGAVTFWLSPLTYGQRTELFSVASKAKESKEMADQILLAKTTIRFSLKDIDGVEQGDGSPFKLEFDPSGMLTEACFDDLMQLEAISSLVKVAGKFAMEGIHEISNIDGVEVDLTKVRSLKKNEPMEVQAPVH